MTDVIANLSAHRATTTCEHCGCWTGQRHERDCPKAKRARSSGRLGKDQERRIERVYGPTKVGEFGDAIDLLGNWWKWQSKATRAPVPLWARIAAWAPIAAHRWITDPIDHMEALFRDLRPLLIRSWVRSGVPTVDLIIVRSTDWAELHGGPAAMSEYMAMTGGFFLDINGRDER